MFNPPINLAEEGKWLLGVTSFEATNFVFPIFVENKSFPFPTPSHWSPEDGRELIKNLNKILELRSGNDIELHVKEVKKGDTGRKKEKSGYNLTVFDHFKTEKFGEIKRS